MKKLVGLILMCALVCSAAPVYALNQPLGINLGFTNFIDGASPGPGWYWTEYLQIIHASDIKDSDGGTMISGANVDAFVNLNQFIYQSDVNFLGGNPGIDVIIPLVAIDADILKVQDGVGDILVGPFIQWGDLTNGPKMLFGRPFFSRFELQVTAPTGDNDNDYNLNPGADVWTINPYYSFTYFITPKLSTSWRIHYLWSSENDDADLRDPTGKIFAEDVQAGQAIHLNYALAYQFTESLRLGVAGYYLKQLEDDEFDDHNASDTKEEVFAIGPGLVLHINKDLTFMGAVNFETEAENRPEGVRSTLRLIWKFW